MFEWVTQNVKLFYLQLKSDLFDILISCCDETLSGTKIEWHNKKSLCIVLCSKGYPDKYRKMY